MTNVVHMFYHRCMHRIPDGWTGPGRAVANRRTARPPRHRCDPPIPVRARILWADNGEHQWIDTVALGWDGRLVKVDARPIQPPHGDYRTNGIWLSADDVKRR